MSHVQSAAVELASLLDDSLAPVYVLDEDRRIIYCNPACARWAGAPTSELLGQQCAYDSSIADGSPAALACGLCPPPKVFSGEPQTAVVSCRTPQGQVVYRRGRFLPLSDGGDESAAVVAVLETANCSPDADQGTIDPDAALHEQLRRLRRKMSARFRGDRLVGTSPAIVRARAQIELAAGSGASVLILGPPGAGKEHAAKTIHYQRADAGPLLPLACALLETNLLRSTLRAAWSRNVSAKEGPATLLLGDVDAMPPEAQSDLVELLIADARRVRVISMAARPLADAVARGEFSADLACRLSTVTIELPALAERLADLPLVAQAFLEEVNARQGKQVGGFSRGAFDQLAAYAWPGNLDELADVVRQAHEQSAGGQVTERDLPTAIHWAARAAAHPARAPQTIVLEQFLAQVEKELIVRAMRRAKGNKTKAARLLGLTRPRLYRRLVSLGMEQPDDKADDERPA